MGWCPTGGGKSPGQQCEEPPLSSSLSLLLSLSSSLSLSLSLLLLLPVWLTGQHVAVAVAIAVAIVVAVAVAVAIVHRDPGRMTGQQGVRKRQISQSNSILPEGIQLRWSHVQVLPNWLEPKHLGTCTGRIATTCFQGYLLCDNPGVARISRCQNA